MSADRRRELEALLRKHGKSSDEEDQLIVDHLAGRWFAGCKDSRSCPTARTIATISRGGAGVSHGPCAPVEVVGAIAAGRGSVQNVTRSEGARKP